MDEYLSDFEKLYRAYYRRMAAYTGTFAAIPEHEREDLAHDILVHAWMRRDLYRPKKGTGRTDEQLLNAWIYALARNFILDRIRGNRLHTVPLIDELPTDRTLQEKTPEDEAVSADVLHGIQNAISAMCERDREIAQLVFYERLTAAEAGRVMHIPGATVRWRLMIMRKALARIVEDRS